MIHEALCELTLMSQITRLARRVHSISGFGGAFETETDLPRRQSLRDQYRPVRFFGSL